MTLDNLPNIYDYMVVYITTNLLNNKKYIGKDTKNNPKYLGSGSLLREDIKKYGKENFKKEILEYCFDNCSLEERETYWINYFQATSNPEYYNIRENVKNWYSNTSETKKQHVRNKISKSNKGRTNSEETKKKISLATLGKLKGNYHTKESKLKISNKNQGRKHTPEEKEKISMKRKGWKPTQDQKNKMSEGRKGHPMYTKEWREKIRQSNKGKKRSEEQKKNQSQKTKGNTNRRKKVLQYSMNMEFIKEWECALHAAESLGKPQGAAITEVCNGKRKSIYGYIWRYKN